MSAANSQQIDPLLSATSLYCERDDRILFDNLDFTLNAGEVLQVGGSNGSGKTTLLRIVCGFNDAFEGKLYWRLKPLEHQWEDFYASVIYMGHRVGINKILSPMENLRWACSLRSQVTDTAIQNALSTLGLNGYEDSPCHTLSAGQQQRVSLARLLISPADLWILDEPFTTLDVHGVADLELMLANHINRGGSVLVTTHHRLQVDGNLRHLNLDNLQTKRQS